VESENYKGYSVWGHAILQDGGYAAGGTIMRAGKLIEGSGILGTYESDEEARIAGLDWCRAWVDSHG
jgi:hypothetical protein